MKKTVIIVGVITALMLTLCILVLTETLPLEKLFAPKQPAAQGATPTPGINVIPMDAVSPEGTLGGGSAVLPIVGSGDPNATTTPGYSDIPTHAPMGYSEQLENFVGSINKRDSETLVMVYHESYWKAAGIGINGAVELMGDNLEEIDLPGDLDYSIELEGDAKDSEFSAIKQEYESYGVAASRIAKVVYLEVHLVGSGIDKMLYCHFIEIDGGWYLYEDLSQLFY